MNIQRRQPWLTFELPSLVEGGPPPASHQPSKTMINYGGKVKPMARTVA